MQKADVKPCKGNAKRLTVFLSVILLTGCAGATLIKSGCNFYKERRLNMPWEALYDAPHDLVVWLNELDAGLVGPDGVCR